MDTLPLPPGSGHAKPPPVQNPYVRLVFGQIGLQALGALGRLCGYPGLALPLIAACRCHSASWRGIGSCGIPVQLQHSIGKDTAGWAQALGLEQRQQGLEAGVDVGIGQTYSIQLTEFSDCEVAQNTFSL